MGNSNALRLWHTQENRVSVAESEESLRDRFGLNRMRIWVGAGIGIVSLWLAFRNVPLSEISTVLTGTNPMFASLALATITVTSLAKAWRWRLLFHPHHRELRLHKFFSILVIGQMINIVVPARLGELARAYLVDAIEGPGKALAIGTIALEKLVDMLMLAFLLILVLPFVSLPEWLRGPGIAFAVAAVGLLLIAIVIAHQKDRLVTAFVRALAVLPGPGQAHLSRQLQLALGGADLLRRWNIMLWVLGCSAMIWFLEVMTNYLAFRALNLNLSLLAALFLLIVLRIGVGVPSLPGRIGVIEYLCVLTLSLFSVDQGRAVSYGVFLHILVFLPPSIMGVLFLWWENRSLARS